MHSSSKKLLLLLLLFLFLLPILFSCADSQFSTTQRTYRNGHYVNVKKPSRDRVSGHARKVPKTTAPRTAGSTASTRNESISYMASNSAEVVVLTPAPAYLVSQTVDEVAIYADPHASRPDTVIIIREKKQIHSTPQQNITTNIPGTGRKLEVLGLIGFILGIIGLFVAGIPLGLTGVILGGIGLGKFKKKPGKFKGKGFAIASIIVGILAIVGAIIVLAAA